MFESVRLGPSTLFHIPSVETAARELREKLKLNNLANMIPAAKKVNLEVFFTEKTHKVNCPLRVIVSKRNTGSEKSEVY